MISNAPEARVWTNTLTPWIGKDYISDAAGNEGGVGARTTVPVTREFLWKMRDKTSGEGNRSAQHRDLPCPWEGRYLSRDFFLSTSVRD
jgi:hypothetical protein